MPPPPRVVDVAPSRLERWVAGFAERHGNYELFPAADTLTLKAKDGATAFLETAFPLPEGWNEDGAWENFVREASRTRVIGLVLVRLGGFATGVFDGDELLCSKVGSRQVHGRSAAGGWSQQRFARRREGQAKVALDAAADAAATIVLPALPKLDGVVTGGDRGALRTVLGDGRLVALAPLVSERVLDVPDPKARVLRESIATANAVRVTIRDPG